MLEREEAEEHVDRKLEILAKLNPPSENFDQDDEDKENSFTTNEQGRERDLKIENERLRREIEALRREVQSKSPTKKERIPLRESKVLSIEREMGKLRIDYSAAGEEQRSPIKKSVRKLGGRRWFEGEDDF